ncbi:MAG: heme-binding beta-barrel domain-containing protein [Bacteroidota bacterium]
MALLLASIILSSFLHSQDNAKDAWSPLRYFVGEWEGSGEGQSGNSTVKRTYRFILGEQFLQVGNTSTYPPQQSNPKGEVHSDLGILSYDKARKTFVARQFHIEGFVNQYVLDSVSANGKTLVFLTESIENIPKGWKAKEEYQIVTDDEFVETFSLAAPGKEFEVYSTTRLKRKQS